MNIVQFTKGFWNNKVIKFFLKIGISLLFCVGIKWLTDYDSLPFQTYRDAALAKAMTSFMVILFLIRKVRLINIESLVGTLLMVFVSHFYFKEVELSPDVYNIRKPLVVVFWLLLMIIIDAIKYKKYGDFKFCKPIGLTLYLMATLIMLICSNGTPEPKLMLIVFGIFFTTLLSKQEWLDLVSCLCNGWFFVSLWLIGKSFVQNYPYETERFYGCFVNIGPFGAFLLCAMMVSIYGMFHLVKTKGWKHPMVWLNMAWFLLITVVTMMTYTVTMFCGLGLVILALFFFARKNLDKKKMWQRAAVLLGVVSVVSVVVLVASQNADYMAAYWHAKYMENGHNPFVYLIYRFYRSFVTEVDYNSMQAMGLAHYDGLLGVLNNFSSGRVYIWKHFKEFFSFSGNPSFGIQVGEYFATNAHCEYVQTIFRFGYVGGGLNIALYCYGMIGSIKEYLKTKEQTYLLAIIWLAGMLGTWLGESLNVIYPITFTGLFLMYPLMKNVENCSVKENSEILGDNMSKI